MSIVIIARWHPREESRAKFVDIVSGLKDAMTPDIVENFSVLLPTMSREGTFVFIEKWASEQVMNQFRSSEVFHRAMTEMSECCDRPLEIEHLNTVDDFDLLALTPMSSTIYPPGKASQDYYPDLGPMTPVYR